MICHTGPCKYHDWLGLTQWCRHPDLLTPLSEQRPVIEGNGGRCSSFVDWELKVMPGEEPPWPDPVDLQALFPRNACKNGETKAKNDTR